MPALKDKATARIEALRARYAWVDHLMRTVSHYGTVDGNLQAGAVTYFAFLSFFPIMALAFAVVGYVAEVYPDAQTALVEAINEILPEMVSEEEEEGKISIEQIQQAAPGIFSIGLVVVLYSGLGWLSSMRTALLAVFEKPQKAQPNFFVGKGKDLLAMVTLGLVLLLSVGVSSVITTASTTVLDALGLGVGLEPLLWILAVVVGLAASTALFYAFFKLLGDPDAPTRSLLSGAVLGAIGFELLKQLSRYLIASTKDQPAFQAFGIALVLVVWIYYFSRVVMYAASWAHTSPAAIAIREQQQAVDSAVKGPQIDVGQLQAASAAGSGVVAGTAAGGAVGRPGQRVFAAGAAAGAAASLGVLAAARRWLHLR
jgi:membrane protein